MLFIDVLSFIFSFLDFNSSTSNDSLTLKLVSRTFYKTFLRVGGGFYSLNSICDIYHKQKFYQENIRPYELQIRKTTLDFNDIKYINFENLTRLNISIEKRCLVLFIPDEFIDLSTKKYFSGLYMTPCPEFDTYIHVRSMRNKFNVDLKFSRGNMNSLKKITTLNSFSVEAVEDFYGIIEETVTDISFIMIDILKNRKNFSILYAEKSLFSENCKYVMEDLGISMFYLEE